GRVRTRIERHASARWCACNEWLRLACARTHLRHIDQLTNRVPRPRAAITRQAARDLLHKRQENRLQRDVAPVVVERGCPFDNSALADLALDQRGRAVVE